MKCLAWLAKEDEVSRAEELRLLIERETARRIRENR
jgi:hypothetical protein